MAFPGMRNHHREKVGFIENTAIDGIVGFLAEHLFQPQL
jgi:hypothetical protein